MKLDVAGVKDAVVADTKKGTATGRQAAGSAGIQRVKSAKSSGVRTGNWLSLRQVPKRIGSAL
jgi:hypothetical protein